MDNKIFLNVEEVAKELGVSKSYAYKVVKQLNQDLKKQGYLTVAGRVNAWYYVKFWYKLKRNFLVSLDQHH